MVCFLTNSSSVGILWKEFLVSFLPIFRWICCSVFSEDGCVFSRGVEFVLSLMFSMRIFSFMKNPVICWDRGAQEELWRLFFPAGMPAQQVPWRLCDPNSYLPGSRSCLCRDRLLKDLGSWKPRLLAADPVTPGEDGLLASFQDVLLLVKKLLHLWESSKFLNLTRFLGRLRSVVFPRVHTSFRRPPETGGLQRFLLVLCSCCDFQPHGSPVLPPACGWHCQRSASWAPAGTAWLKYTFRVWFPGLMDGFFSLGLNALKHMEGFLALSCAGSGAVLSDPFGSLPAQHFLWFYDEIPSSMKSSLPKEARNWSKWNWCVP